MAEFCVITKLSQFQLLIEPLGQAVGPQVKPGTDAGSHCSEDLPDLGGELRTPVQNDLQRNAMEPENMINEQLGGFGSCG